MERKPMHKNPGGENDFCPTTVYECQYPGGGGRAKMRGSLNCLFRQKSPIPGGMEWKSWITPEDAWI